MSTSSNQTFLVDIGAVARWPTPEAREWAERAFAPLCSSPDILAVVLFGSTVRPVDSSFDLDCLYIYRGERPDLPAVPIEVDLRGYPADRVDELIEGAHDLLLWSIRFGRLVCERNGYWTHLTAYWSSRLPFPSAEVAEARAAEADRLYADLREVGDEDAAIEQLVTALTHRARAALLRANIFPASRPELPAQLREIGEIRLADALSVAIEERNSLAHEQILDRSTSTDDAA